MATHFNGSSELVDDNYSAGTIMEKNLYSNLQKKNSVERDDDRKDESESLCPYHRHYFNHLRRREV